MEQIETLCIAGYRSLRDVRLGLKPVTVITGTNGSGKSSLYRGIRLLAEVAQGRIMSTLAREGGFVSALWAGPERISLTMRERLEPNHGVMRRTPVSLRLGVASASQGYAIDLGLPPPIPPSRFDGDPEIKLESLWTGRTWRRATAFAERHGPSVRIRDERSTWRDAERSLASFDSMLTHCANGREAIELLMFRESVRTWRFYDHFRTDPDAPARQRQVGTRAPILSSDGSDLAAALATIIEIGSGDDLAEVLDDAFPGTSIDVSVREGTFWIEVRQQGLLRALRAEELSDGTLRYLLLVTALLTPRPPPLMVFNEPETSLHPDLIVPLARLIMRAATKTQIIIISHERDLVSALVAAGASSITLAKEFGETTVQQVETPSWTWPAR